MVIKKKASQWIKDNKDILISVGITSVIVGGSIWLIKAKEISMLKDYVDVIDDVSWEQLDRIVDLEYRVSELEELCLAKDAHITELASELLRRGSSIGGHLMADRKAFLNAAA